jgi:tetratricopeptide (TPR) repeat protein
MKTAWFVRMGTMLLLTVSISLVGSLTGIAHAAEGQGGAGKSAPPKSTRKVPTISEQVFKKLGEAQALIDGKQYNQAISLLLGIVDARKYNTNEKGQIHNMLGFAYYSKEDYPNAIKHYKEVAAMKDGVPEGLETTTLYTLAQLSFIAERYQDALNFMQQWIRIANNPGHDPHIFMGQVYYQMKDYKNAIAQVEKGVAIARERGVTVKEQWVGLLNFLYYEAENWPKVIETAQELVIKWPKSMYWMRLAGMYGQLDKEQEQLWTMQAAHAAKMLEKSGDYTNLAGLLMQAEMPFKAAKVMKEGLDRKVIDRNEKTLQNYGQALQLAGDVQPAIKVFEEAAAISADGKIYERLANLYLDDDKHDKCVVAADHALERGGLRKVAAVYSVRGMCLFNQDKLSAASSSFVSCANEARRTSDETHIRICQQWITFIERDGQRRRELQAAGAQ